MGDRFAGKVALVTGGARGIGAAVIAAFLKEGGRTVSLDLSKPDEPLAPTRYVTDRSGLVTAFESIDQEEGRIDILVNNAGFQRVGMRHMPADWQDG